MKEYLVKNRSSSIVVYSIPDTHVRRQFAPGEVKKIPHEELEKLAYQTGGEILIRNYLQINDLEVAKEFNAGQPLEPEYNLDKDSVRDLLLNKSLDALLDALDFAPAGVIDLIKTEAVKLPLGDIPKIQAIKSKTGFDVAAAIQHMAEEKAAEKEETKTTDIYDNGGKRRVAETATSGRRTDTKYNIVSMEESK